jgi:hypothetical protein
MRFLLTAFVALLALQGSSQSSAARLVFNDAYEYNDYIIAQQTLVVGYYDEFAAVVSDSTSTKAQATQKRLELLPKVRACETNIKNLPDWKGNTSFRDSAKACFAYYVRMFQVEYVELINIWYTDPFTETEEAKLEAFNDRTIGEQDKLDEALIRTQEAFAKQFGLVLEEDAPAEE